MKIVQPILNPVIPAQAGIHAPTESRPDRQSRLAPPHRLDRRTGALHGRLLLAATLLAFCVVGLGAFVRLADAGLGCPDWPGCYGQLIGVPQAAHEVASAAQAFPGQPVHAGKAWKEMIHRYAAGTLGLLVLAIALSAWRRGSAAPGTPASSATAAWRPLAAPESGLLALIVLQAALGMWTVTLLLKPVIVTLHLLGGMATWATLVLLLRREYGNQDGATGTPDAQDDRGRALSSLSALGSLAIALVFAQIALGGWVSSNYAALACPDFPACRNGEFWPATDFGHAFTLLRNLHATASGEALPFSALTAIHLAHRLGALLVLLVVGAYALKLRRAPDAADRRAGTWVLGALALQIALGVGNVLLHLPLPLAVAHNLGAALLLGTLILSAGNRAR